MRKRQARKVIRLLDDTRAFFDAHQWGQGSNSYRSFCLLEAIAISSGQDRSRWSGDPTGVRNLAQRELKARTDYQRLWNWNDAYGRTRADVVNLLEETANDLRRTL